MPLCRWHGTRTQTYTTRINVNLLPVAVVDTSTSTIGGAWATTGKRETPHPLVILIFHLIIMPLQVSRTRIAKPFIAAVITDSRLPQIRV